jgi:AcrR family transcriptional regulator
MPKVVDHEKRRHDIAEAMWRVIARDGLAAASARTVAAEAGWSLGAVRHYFGSQNELLLFATSAMIEGAAARVSLTLERRPPGLARCQEVLEHLLPLDDVRTGEIRVWLAVLIRSHTDPHLSDLRLTAWHGTRHLCRVVVAELAERPHPPEAGATLSRRLEPHAASLHVWLDGLTLQAASVPELLPSADVRRAVRRQLTGIRERVRA